MNTPFPTVALSAISLPEAAPNEVPDWIRLVPNGKAAAYDGRGAFWYEDAAAVISASFGFSPRIHIDANHSTEKLAKLGGDAEAHGYITEMEERPDGIWGRVDWNPSGTRLMGNRSYWGLSPVLFHDKNSGKIHAIKNVALTNDPALRGLAILSAEETTGMDFLNMVAEMLGLAEGASEEDVMTALKKKLEAKPESAGAGAAQAELSAVHKALGLGDGVTQTEAVVTATALAASAAQVTALQARVGELEQTGQRAVSDAWVQAQLSAGAAIPAGKEELFAQMHMENPERAADIVASMGNLGATSLTGRAPRPAGDLAVLSADQKTVADQLGISHATFLDQLKADGQAEGAL